MYKTMQEAVGKPAFKKLIASQKPSNLENSRQQQTYNPHFWRQNKSGSTLPVNSRFRNKIPNFWLQAQDSFSSISTQVETEWNYPNNPDYTAFELRADVIHI